ncbi:hypothetical protein [Halalkalibacter akibai]|uniref:ABC transporter substrate-binding protein n=1 Tax=Halalkalibacter akibai (strain ATCC 43226 / DSM 21942 / CIP 109018 / JCM 9157 / 1139) TaxID=1236973 RepID=W4QNB5_HALA3|nr:hypothetical protein [Halalkalibacter akibai]GAE33566.1 hypothetical protein JCM9157_578 [Halalkalibacter akibai JCM 9157]
MRKLGIVAVMFLLLLTVSSCGKNEEMNKSTLDVMFLSNIPSNINWKFDSYLRDILVEGGFEVEDLEINVQLYPPSHDKLTIEILAKQVDVFIVDESLKLILMDPFGLLELDSILVSSPELKANPDLYFEDEETGKTSLFGVSLTNDSRLLRDLGLTLQSPLIGVVTKGSPHKEKATHILKALYEIE